MTTQTAIEHVTYTGVKTINNLSYWFLSALSGTLNNLILDAFAEDDQDLTIDNIEARIQLTTASSIPFTAFFILYRGEGSASAVNNDATLEAALKSNISGRFDIQRIWTVHSQYKLMNAQDSQHIARTFNLTKDIKSLFKKWMQERKVGTTTPLYMNFSCLVFMDNDAERTFTMRVNEIRQTTTWEKAIRKIQTRAG